MRGFFDAEKKNQWRYLYFSHINNEFNLEFDMEKKKNTAKIDIFLILCYTEKNLQERIELG